jgi:CheY-like chemotaxis protein
VFSSSTLTSSYSRRALPPTIFEVRTAHSGPEALHICARERADVVLFDVMMMPGMDGFEACRRPKADPRSQHIPVIMVTALDQPSDRVKGLEAGADAFLTKPRGARTDATESPSPRALPFNISLPA